SSTRCWCVGGGSQGSVGTQHAVDYDRVQRRENLQPDRCSQHRMRRQQPLAAACCRVRKSPTSPRQPCLVVRGNACNLLIIMVEPRGLEPLTFALRTRRSPN